MAAFKFKITSPGPERDQKETDWNICFVCQEEDGGEMVIPYQRKGFAADPQGSSYNTTAQCLKEWEQEGFNGPFLQRVQMYDTHSDLLSAFINNSAVFHKACVNRYDNYKLKRKKAINTEVPEKVTKLTRQQISAPTRQQISAPNFTNTCFFCEKDENLHSCQTFSLDRQIRMMAEKLQDTKLIAKLSAGDMCATEAKYHKKCLTSFYNRYRRDKTKSSEDFNLSTVEGVALSEVVEWIKDSITSSYENNIVPVFQQKDVVEMYNNQLMMHGAPPELTKNTHCTRLKQKILDKIPGLCETKKGRCILYTIDDEVGQALFEACRNSNEEDGVIISKAAKVIRKALFSSEETFDGDVSQDRQLRSVPKILVQLISLIIEGGDLDRTVSSNLERIACNISQLIRFNAIKQTRRSVINNFRHSSRNEPPLPVIIGLTVHAKTRKKAIIQHLAEEGISVSYDRVMTIRRMIANQVCKNYQEEGIVYPPTLRERVFTSSAVDNIDHNLSSVTAKSSFHGTSISIFQHPEDGEGTAPFKVDLPPPNDNARHQLPETYTNIKPTMGGKPNPPKSTTEIISDFPSQTSIYDEACGWINKLSEESDTVIGHASFAAFHSQKCTATTIHKSISHLLPLIPESVNSHATVRHSMAQVKAITEKVNPGQSPVITGDQPVYAIGKQVQWMFPDEFKDFVWMMGSLHIEMAFMAAIGDWLEGSGWKEIYEVSKVNTSGRIDSFLRGKEVKRTRYSHAITLSALVTLSKTAFNSQEEFSDYKEWRKHQEEQSVTSKYWFTLIDMHILLFMFVRSLRESDFDLFVKCLQEMIPWMFALDHINYSRWMSVFIKDMLALPDNTQVFEEFKKGNFTIKRSNRKFSAMAEDQAHEQNNKIVKVDGGAIGILDQAQALLDWSTAGPYIAEIINNARRGTPDNAGIQKHHEHTDAYEKAFQKDRKDLLTAFARFGNPFTEQDPGLMQIVTRCVFSESAAGSVSQAHAIGLQQSSLFMKERLGPEKNKSLYDTISKNKLKLFRSQNVIVTCKEKQKAVSLKEQVQLYASLYVACQSRQGDLDDFFKHENHEYPPALSEYGKIRTPNNKADFITCLSAITEGEIYNKYEAPPVDAYVIDGPAYVHMNAPKFSRTYGEYCEKEIASKVQKMARNVSRVDFVFDVYDKSSQKRETRESRGSKSGIRISVRADTPIYRKNELFMANDENKTELFCMMADALVSSPNNDTVIVSTSLQRVLSNQEIDTSTLQPCNHEEADTRLFLHVKNMSSHGYNKVTIISVDTDVVVIALALFHNLELSELWIEFGVGKDKKWMPIHQYASKLGEQKCRALLFWYAFTGCDTVSQFAGRAKKTAWKTWLSFPDVTEVFIRLADLHEISTEDKTKVERFVCLMYNPTSSVSEVNQCRRLLFVKNARTIENCPPTSNALMEHIKRSQERSYKWAQSLKRIEEVINIEEWGWIVKGDGLVYPRWSTLPKAALACKELKKCKCRSNCSDLDKCTCKIYGLPCTDRCKCSGKCE